MIDVQVKRGADAASDHHLVICKLRLKLKAAKKLQEQSGKKYNVSSLKKKETLNSFKISLKNRYEALDCDVDLDTLWTGVKQMYTDTCDSILGPYHRTLPTRDHFPLGSIRTQSGSNPVPIRDQSGINPT